MAAVASVGQGAGRSHSWACTNRRVAVGKFPGRDRVYLDGLPVAIAEELSLLVAGNTMRCCSGCALRSGKAIEALIMEGMRLSVPGSYTCLLTFTEGSWPRGYDEHVAAVGRCLEDVRRLQWRKRGNNGVPPGSFMPYISVREIQESRFRNRGELAWHTHSLVRGWLRVTRDEMKALTDRHGLGDAHYKAERVVDGLAGEQAARYMVKKLGGYLSKNHQGDSYALVLEHLPKRKQLMSRSESWAPGVTLGGLRAESVRRLKERLAVQRHNELCNCGKALEHLGPKGVEFMVVQLLADMGLAYVVEPEPPPDVAPADWEQEVLMGSMRDFGAYSR